MKKTLLFSISLLFAITSVAQEQGDSVSWVHDGITRHYLEYVPDIYDGSEAVPLVVALHGLGDSIHNFFVGFEWVADTANFILVTPQAIYQESVLAGTAWNSGAGAFGITLNPNIDDIGFIDALIDTVVENYNIDENRIYAAGFSMGGFMTNRLGCEMNDRIAAFASVAGTIGPGITCDPGEPVNACHFHGTSDQVIGYTNNFAGINVSEWIDFWNNNNGCSSVSLEGRFPDSSNDGFTVDYYEYAGCNNETRTVHYKVNGADHQWLGPSNDIFYTTEIWKFFLGLSPDNLAPSGVPNVKIEPVSIYPNPTSNTLRLENVDSKILNVSIFDSTGQLVKEISAVTNVVDVNDLKQGVYQLMVATEDGLYSNSFVKE